MMWENWAGNVTAKPADIVVPDDVAGLSAILADARSQRKCVRVVGSGHSWSPLVATDGVMVRMTNFADLAFDPIGSTVTMGPGVTVDALAQFLIQHQVCVPSSVGIGLGEATMGGVFSTGCHGSGINTPSVSDWIVAVVLMASDGTLREYSLEQDGAQVMNALRLSLGMLGVVISYRIVVEPMFNVHVVEWKATVDDAMSNVRHLVTENDYAEISWMPFNDGMWMQKANRTTSSATRDGFTPASNSFRDLLYELGSSAALDALERDPGMTPDILRTSFQMLDPGDYVSSVTHYIHCADYGFFLDTYKLIDIEAVFEIDENFDAVRLAFEIARRKVAEWASRGQYPLNVTLGFRFIRNSTAVLSSCRDNGMTCMAEVFSYHKTPLFKEFAAELLDAWMGELPKARTHWAKAFQYLPNMKQGIREAFGPQLEEFMGIREYMGVDPSNLFVNDTLAEIFDIDVTQG